MPQWLSLFEASNVIGVYIELCCKVYIVWMPQWWSLFEASNVIGVYIELCCKVYIVRHLVWPLPVVISIFTPQLCATVIYWSILISCNRPPLSGGYEYLESPVSCWDAIKYGFSIGHWEYQPGFSFNAIVAVFRHSSYKATLHSKVIVFICYCIHKETGIKLG